jgi:hypothetical protein
MRCVRDAHRPTKREFTQTLKILQAEARLLRCERCYCNDIPRVSDAV